MGNLLWAEVLAKRDAVVAGEIEAEWRRTLEELVGLSDEHVLEWVRLKERGVVALEHPSTTLRAFVRQWLRAGRPPAAWSADVHVGSSLQHRASPRARHPERSGSLGPRSRGTWRTPPSNPVPLPLHSRVFVHSLCPEPVERIPVGSSLRDSRPTRASALPSAANRLVGSCLAGLSREALAAQRELVTLRETLFLACREVALRAAEKAVGPGGDMASFVAEKAARQAVFARLYGQHGGSSRVSTMLVTQLTENVIENRRSVFDFLTREQVMGRI